VYFVMLLNRNLFDLFKYCSLAHALECFFTLFGVLKSSTAERRMNILIV
jgi:hypothetical protein